MTKIRRMIKQNRSIKEIAIQKKVYSVLIAKIPNGWNPLVSKRLRAYGVDSDLINNWVDVKTVTNGWHTSSRMHEATCLPCILGYNSLPINTIALSASVVPASSTKDQAMHCLICPILVGIISQACGLDHLPNLHEVIFWERY